MGIFRGILTGVLGVAFLGALGNVAHLAGTDAQGSGASAAAGGPRQPLTPGGVLAE
ncbi:hypothetical protein HKCCSP123_18640, partial [Rhodobacterales bacterium HKCCSP123]|nr:hypothetical protein [Rhodobacterales bacterium HKCCSP123]